MKHLLTIMLILGLTSASSYAKQLQNIQGKVVNAQSQPVPGASVYLLSSSAKAVMKTTVTNERGEYIFSNVPKGNFMIEVSAVSYEKAFSENVLMDEKSIIVQPILLNLQTTAIATVDIERALPMIQSNNGKLILNVENSALSAGSNALEIVTRAPGVSLDKDDNLTLMGSSGVNVTLDGRQTYMSSEQLATLLKSTDGNQIKSVEVTTNRTAKDDAEGAVGTINIVMKKSKVEGFNGALIGSAATGAYFRGNSSLNLNYKKKNTTIFGNYSYTNNKLKQELGIERTIRNNNINTVFDQNTDLIQVDKTHNYKVGIEQKTSTRNTLLAQFTGNNNVEDSQNHSITKMGRTSSAIDSIMTSNSPSKDVFNRYSFNLNNEFKIDTMGKKLITDVDYSFFKTANNIQYAYYTYLPDFRTLLYDPEFERSDSRTKVNILSAKLDYVQPLGKGQLEAGLKYSHVKSDNDIYFEFKDGETWENFENRSNSFLYKEQITAGYLDYSVEVDKWNIKAGLRGEHTISEGNSVSLNTTVKRRYFDLFPSASLGYNAHENHVLSLNYSRKVSRPNYRYLNPFEYYIDKRTFMKGNTGLNPEYTHGITLNYTLYKMFNITLGHDLTNDAVVESLGQDTVQKTSWVIRENLGRTNRTYLNLSLPARIGSFWTMYNNLTAIHMYFKGPIAGYEVSTGSYFFQGRSINTFKINKSLNGELIVSYNSPFLYNVYRIHARFNTDIGATYTFKDQRNSLKLAVTDILRTNQNDISTDFEEYKANIRQYRDSQTIRLTYTYKFGNLKQSFNRKEARNEEKERAMQ